MQENKSNYETGKTVYLKHQEQKRKKKTKKVHIMVVTIRFALGLFPDRSIKKKNNPAIKGLKDYCDIELLDEKRKWRQGINEEQTEK